MASILPFDELNKFNVQIREQYAVGKVSEEDIIDELLDLFLLAYALGNEVTNENLGSDWKPSADEAKAVIDEKSHRIANTSALDTANKAGATQKTWVTMMDDRVRETHDYLEGMTVGIGEDFYTYDGDHAPAPGGFELAENNVNCRCELVFS